MATTFPTYPATTFEQAVELAIFSSNQLHNIINADATSVIETEDGNIPSIRYALIDNLYFKTPAIDWEEGLSVTVFNQLYTFSGGTTGTALWYAPTATASNPITTGTSPEDDDNWRLYGWDTYSKKELNSTSGASYVGTSGGSTVQSELDLADKFAGVYEDGIITITSVNSWITYNGDRWYVKPGTTVPFITTGSNSVSWKVDSDNFIAVGDTSIREDLAKTTGSGLVVNSLGLTLEETSEIALSYGAIRISTYKLLGYSDIAAFEAALVASKDSAGYMHLPVWNDTASPIELTSRYTIQSHSGVSVSGNTFTGNRAGIFGAFKLTNGAGFDVQNTYDAVFELTITDGGSNVMDTSTDTNSSFALKFTGGNNVGTKFLVNGYGYTGWLVGSTDTDKYNLQCVRESSINAYSCGGPCLFTHETGFGNLLNIWQELCSYGPRLKDVNDFSLHSYENYQSIALGGGEFLIQNCLSCHLGNFLSGNGGNPQLKIYDSWVDIKTLLVIPGPYKNNQASSDYYGIEVAASKLQVGAMTGSCVGSIMKAGHDSFVFIDSFTGEYINQLFLVTNDMSYAGTNTGTTATIRLNAIYVSYGNNDYCYSSKSCIKIEDSMSANIEIFGGKVWWSNSRTVDTDYGYFLDAGANKDSRLHVTLDLAGNYFSGYGCNIPDALSIRRLKTPGIESVIGGVSTIGGGTVLPTSKTLVPQDTAAKISSYFKFRSYMSVTLSSGATFSLQKNGATVGYISGIVGTVMIPPIDIAPGETCRYYGSGTYSVANSYGEILLA